MKIPFCEYLNDMCIYLTKYEPCPLNRCPDICGFYKSILKNSLKDKNNDTVSN